MALGEGHKFLLASATSPTTIYLSSIPGITTNDYDKFSEDNFFFQLDYNDTNQVTWSKSWRGGQERCGGADLHFADASYSCTIVSAIIEYDNTNGKITFTPCIGKGTGGGGTCHCPSVSGEEYLSTSLYFIK